MHVRELATGDLTTVDVSAARSAPEEAPSCRVGDHEVRVADLFPTQREAVLGRVGRGIADAARAGRRAALGAARAVLQPLLDADMLLLPPLAEVYGLEEAEAVAAAAWQRPLRLAPVEARIADLRRRGLMLPTAWLATQLEAAVLERVGELPRAAPDVVAILDLAVTAGVALDLSTARIATLTWWKRASVDERQAAPLASLGKRLGIAPAD